MKLKTYQPNDFCPKCGFPMGQMRKIFFDTPHQIMDNNEVSVCKVKGEHMHLECSCSNELTRRPMDWKEDDKPKRKSPVKKAPVKKVPRSKNKPK
jgi:hypothetical protein